MGQNQFWTQKRVEKLGTKPDTALASLWAVPVSRVRKERMKRDIPRYSEAYRWSDNDIALLGQQSDLSIAVTLKLNRETVRQKRIKLGIEPVRPAPVPGVTWTEEMDIDLGWLKDPEVAEKYNIHVNTVRIRRRTLGIQGRGGKWRRHQWPQHLTDRLGKELDVLLAAEAGVRPSTVAAERKRLGIKRPPRPTKVNWEDPLIRKLLGSMSDQMVATELGVNVHTVAVRRRAIGIPPHKEPKRVGKPTRLPDPTT